MARSAHRQKIDFVEDGPPLRTTNQFVDVAGFSLDERCPLVLAGEHDAGFTTRALLQELLHQGATNFVFAFGFL